MKRWLWLGGFFTGSGTLTALHYLVGMYDPAQTGALGMLGGSALQIACGLWLTAHGVGKLR